MKSYVYPLFLLNDYFTLISNFKIDSSFPHEFLPLVLHQLAYVQYHLHDNKDASILWRYMRYKSFFNCFFIFCAG